MPAKFAMRDRISLNDRFPLYPGLVRRRPRRVVAIEYDPVARCTFYILGSNQRGACAGEPTNHIFSAYRIRSYQGELWNVTGINGKPRVKRQYRKPSSGPSSERVAAC